MTPTHTPGPWKVAAVGIEEEGYRDILDEKGNRVASMSARGNGQDLQSRASLIAAAPALLAALQYAERRLKCYERWVSDEVLMSRGTKVEKLILEDVRQALPDMQAAITQAEGEKP